MLYLNKESISQIDRSMIQEAVRHAYHLVLDKAFNMPDRMHVADNENMLLLMPCFSEKYFATKLVSVFPEAGKHGLPAVNGVLVLCDNLTGQPLAFMDGAAVTAERTGAVGGLGVDCLAPDKAATAGIFGAGVQGRSQARYLLLNRPVTTLWVHDLFPEASQKMVKDLESEFPDLEFKIARDPLELVRESQIIIAATTTKNPLFEIPADRVSDLTRSKTFVSIGSFRPDMKEFPDPVILAADTVYVDTPFAAQESGDICIPLKGGIIGKEKIEEFASLMKNPVPREGKTYFFKSVGMALFDLAVASAVYDFAVKESIGQDLSW
ncbi:ornithine cyclodeaminase family protein [Desulfospira joergensenii]|uniref:ornithine cyclodeaminase family protein n=1 Tax=Desulfospira joergensenii TaxID=53329 RepID=UPI0003B595C7|nr:ornithine cyclodeaminase family protein [Desulfospira joergensenii]